MYRKIIQTIVLNRNNEFGERIAHSVYGDENKTEPRAFASSKNKHIIIVGCGLSGMITALSFAAYNIPVTIVESQEVNSESFFNDIRTTAITASSKKFFKKINIWQKIETLSSSINDIYVLDNKAPTMLHFNSDILKTKEKMGYLIENKSFKKQLLNLVRLNKDILLIDNSTYVINENNEEYCSILVNNQYEIRSDLLIVCDGSKSSIKEQYFSNEIERSYKQHAITFIAHHQKSHEGTAVEHFLPNGIFAILPLKNKNLSSVVWTIKSDMKDVLLSLPREEFLYLVQQNFGDFLGNVSIESDIAAFSLKTFFHSK